MSVSEQWREKGNSSYRRATDDLSPALRVLRLQEAINSYGRALSTAVNNYERSSACKNMAMANWKMAKAQSANEGPSSKISFYYREALSHFQDAKDCGSGRDAAWQDSLVDAGVRCWFDVSERLEEWEAEERIHELHQLVGYIIDDATKAKEYLEVANHYFSWSVMALGARDYKQTLTLLKECHFPLKEAEKFGRRVPQLTRECAFLEEDIFTQTCVAESIQERMKGEALLSHVIRDEEVLNIDVIWEVVDSFRLAAQLTRDRDLEMEAMALSALGRVFDKILKLKDRAKACLMKVLELANAMIPRAFTGEEWFEFARSTVERYQQEQVRSTEQQHQKEREEFLKQIKDEVDTLQKNHKDMTKLKFLKFVYSTHPPKNPAHKMKEVSDSPEFSELQKLYQRAVIHYHPDKADVEKHGKTWKVLCEEITKLLTSHYEFFKGCDTAASKKL
ncbi:uncharacterized protein LOC143288991 isoform X2 [Babylonia areolata]